MLKKIIAFVVSTCLTLAFTLNRAITGENNPYHEMTIGENRFAAENSFISQKRERKKLPTFEQERDNLPKPVWDGHQDAIDCYYKAWELAFGNLRRPALTSGFVSNYIDTAFNGEIFMWAGPALCPSVCCLNTSSASSRTPAAIPSAGIST